MQRIVRVLLAGSAIGAAAGVEAFEDLKRRVGLAPPFRMREVQSRSMDGSTRTLKLAGRIALMALVVLTAIALWKTSGSGPDLSRVAVVRTPQGIMGTTCALVAVVPRGHEADAQRGLEAAEQSLREVDALMSTYLEESELSSINRAAAGDVVPVSEALRSVLLFSRDVWGASDGAFDATCRPMIELWRSAAQDGRLPSDGEMETSRLASSWDDFEILEGGVSKHRADARLDLGGVAKGYGIDRAFDALASEGCDGILVDVGGDVRVGGLDARGEPWRITVRDPFGGSNSVSIELDGGAVCTSGNYERFIEIDGVRHSHIIDPRTGRPADRLPSVTVLAADAKTADAWATALSVLGPDGLGRLPPDVEALLIEGDVEDCIVHATPGMEKHLGGLPVSPGR